MGKWLYRILTAIMALPYILVLIITNILVVIVAAVIEGYEAVWEFWWGRPEE